MAEERAHHQAAAAALNPAAAVAPSADPLGVGSASFGDLIWQSPLRAVARARAEQAVADATGSARQATAALEATLAPFRPPPPAPVHQESHWYDQVTGFFGGVYDGVAEPVGMIGGLVGLNGDVSDNWAALGSGLLHGVTHPVDFGKALIDWDDLSKGNYGHWAGELAPTIVAAIFSGGAGAAVKGVDATAAAERAGTALNAMRAVAKGLPDALKDIRVVMAETPEGLRLPAGVDASSLRQLMSEASSQAARDKPGGGAIGEGISKATAGEALAKPEDVLGRLPKGRQPSVRTVGSEAELQRVYDELAHGGTSIEVPGYKGSWVERPDGIRVGLREISKSGGRTIDIRMPDGKTWKVHIT
jgi:hypothetical protein